MEVDLAHTHVLLSALLGVQVVLSDNNAPSPAAVGDQERKGFFVKVNKLTIVSSVTAVLHFNI